MKASYIKKLVMMLISVCVMGMCVSLLVMTSFGPDPCSAMNYGVADLVGLSFGTYQAALNVVLFIFVFFCSNMEYIATIKSHKRQQDNTKLTTISCMHPDTRYNEFTFFKKSTYLRHF